MGVIYTVSIFIRTILIYIVLTIMMKIMGKRRIGELEADELVSTLLISEIAAMVIGESDIPLFNAIIPILFICSLEVLLSAIKTHSRRLKQIIEGKSVYIIYKGRLMQDELERNRISINEILSEMRTQGVGDISKVYYAILEANGKLSLLTKDNAADAGHTVIIDGAINKTELKALGMSEKDLRSLLLNENVSAADVFLLTILESGEHKLVRKERKE